MECMESAGREVKTIDIVPSVMMIGKANTKHSMMVSGQEGPKYKLEVIKLN